MTAPDTAAIRAQVDALTGFTPGPWGWEVNCTSQRVELCGGKGGTDLTVMSFARWGMNKAAPVFWFWRGSVSDEPQRADALAVPVLGREHHARWLQRIDHPDARLIAAAPDMHATILTLCNALDEARAERNEANRTADAALAELRLLQAENERLSGLLAEAIQWNWIDFEETPTETAEACLPSLVDLNQRITAALSQKETDHD